MKLFSKKSEHETLHNLGEEEIQKRLYGRYHRGTSPKSEGSKATLSATQLQLEVPTLSQPSFVTRQFKVLGTRSWTFFAEVLRNFPWKFSIAVMGSVALAILIFQFVPSWFSERGVNVSAPAPGNAVYQTQIVETSKSKKLEQNVLPAAPLKIETQPAVSETSRKRYYAAQVCTYQKEGDARGLTTQLKALGFPAFYLKSPAAQSGITHYAVFLSKEETYAEANSKLTQFRQTEAFEKFSDSFIRSL